MHHLPERERPWIRSKLRAAWSDPEHDEALKSLRALAAQLDRVHPDAAGSLREGTQETHTLTRLGAGWPKRSAGSDASRATAISPSSPQRSVGSSPSPA